MQNIRLTDKDGNGFRPPCYADLAAFQGPLYNAEHDLPRPIGIFNHAWSSVIESFHKTLTALENVKKDTQDRQPLIDALISAYQGLIYQSTEFFDDVSHNIAKCFSPAKKPVDISGPKKLREIAAVLCNKLKHNHNRLHYVEAQSQLFAVQGFAFYRIHNGVLEPNPEVHRGRGAMSFNVELRKLLAGIYLYSYECGKKIAALPGDRSKISTAPDPNSIALLDRVTNLPCFAMPFESKRHMPVLSFDGHQLSVSLSDGQIFPVSTSTKMMANFIGDGTTKSFKVP
jgi:hypothetical protein